MTRALSGASRKKNCAVPNLAWRIAVNISDVNAIGIFIRFTFAAQ